MSNIVPDTVERVELDEDWVDIKTRMGIGDYDQIEVLTRSEDVGRVAAVLLVNVKKWSLKDKNDKSLPVNVKTINQLDYDTAVAILTKIGELNPRLQKGV